jgi:hypothetical protein
MRNHQERGRLVRWQQFLMHFNLQVSHVAGKSNSFADGLSRLPQLSLMLASTTLQLDPLMHDISESQKKERFARCRMQEALNPKLQNNWRMISGVLFYTGDAGLRLYVPESKRTQLLHEQHAIPIGGHVGWHKVMHALNQWYYWPTMLADVKSFVRACPHCQLFKSTRQPTTEIVPSVILSRPFADISLDWVSGLTTSKTQCNSFLSILDRVTKWAIVIPCDKCMDTARLIDLLWNRVFSWVRLPVKIAVDVGTR